MTFGQFGVWIRPAHLTSADTASTAAEIEALGYGTVWLGGSPAADLTVVEQLLDATSTLNVATGIVNIWTADAPSVAASYSRIENAHPGRFLLGVGTGHRESVGGAYKQPYSALVRYLDELDTLGVPKSRRALAALGPRVLRLSADRTLGAHPYLTTPEHTRWARSVLGDGVLLAPEHKVVLVDDPARAREIARPGIKKPYLGLANYVAHLRRLGYTDDDLAGSGSDRLIDDLVAHGSVEAVAARLSEHLAAGADHVAVQVIPTGDEGVLPALRTLAPVLF
jgi:probable F420-dependent oxidoreductase